MWVLTSSSWTSLHSFCCCEKIFMFFVQGRFERGGNKGGRGGVGEGRLHGSTREEAGATLICSFLIFAFFVAGLCGPFQNSRRRGRTLCQEAILAWRACLLLWGQENSGGGVPLWEHDSWRGGRRRLLLLQPGGKFSKVVGSARGSGDRKWKWLPLTRLLGFLPSEAWDTNTPANEMTFHMLWH